MVGLRLSCDELAPWAGVTPEQAADHVADLADLVDLLAVVRGGPYSVDRLPPRRPHPGRVQPRAVPAMRAAAAGRAAVVLQGSVVDPASGRRRRSTTGTADLVEMTRAQIAEPDLVALVRAGRDGEARPCILCNQACRVRDNRNPIVSCVGEPRAGHETVDVDPATAPAGAGGVPPTDVLVVGAGLAGLECARVLALRGHRVRRRRARPTVTGGALARGRGGPGPAAAGRPRRLAGRRVRPAGRGRSSSGGR